MTPRSPHPHQAKRLAGTILGALLLVGVLPAAVLAAPATKLVITSVIPASQTSGQAINVVVEAQDGSSSIDPTFTGSVTFVTSDGAATVSPASGYTYTLADAGTKTFAVTLRSFGDQTFRFQSSGLTDTATKTVNVTASRAVFITTPSGGQSDVAWATQPDVEIRDETGAKVTTSTATIALAIGTNPGAGVLSGCANLTAVAGLVDVSGCKIDKAGTGYTLIASSSGLASGTSGPFNVTPGPATKLGFATQPSRGTLAAAFATQPAVEIQDAAGNRVTTGVDSTKDVTLAISTNPGAGTLSCTGGLTKTASSGLATFSGCAINNVGVGYVVTATSSGLASKASSAFDVADRLVFTSQPSASTSAGIAFATQPVVAVRAGAGTNTATNDQATAVVLSIKAGTGATGAILTCDGGLSKTVTNGVATFSGCRIDKISPTSPANPYKLIASATNLASVESGNVAIVAGAASKLGFTAQPNAGVASQSFPIQPVVAVQDAGGNTVTSGTNSTATVTLSLGAGAPAGAALTCTGGLSKAAVAGVATFAGCSINSAGTFTLVASATGLTSATSTSFVLTAPTAAITLTTSAPIPPGAQNPVILWGQGFTLTTQFGVNGASKQFQLQGSRDLITWTTIATQTTDANGRASLFYTPVTNLYYRAVFAGAGDLGAANSNQVRTVVRQLGILRPTNNGSTKTISRNTSIQFTMTARPARPELQPAVVSFYLYKRVSGVWQVVSKRNVTIDSAGLARTTWKFASTGDYYVRGQVNPTAYNANSVMTSPERYNVR